MHTSSRVLTAVVGLSLAVAVGCGESDSSGTGGAGGTAAAGGTGATGGSGGTTATGGTAGATPIGGTGGIDCSNVGCAAPPLCATGCTAACGCCSCGDGETSPVDGGFMVCVGGCYELHDAGAADAQSD